jgi:aerobic C4-dicarboxylate transport protein
MTLILGIDRFMSECRALTNLVGNAVATIVVARWEGELDADQLNSAMSGELPPLDTSVTLHQHGEVGIPAHEASEPRATATA